MLNSNSCNKTLYIKWYHIQQEADLARLSGLEASYSALEARARDAEGRTAAAEGRCALLETERGYLARQLRGAEERVAGLEAAAAAREDKVGWGGGAAEAQCSADTHARRVCGCSCCIFAAWVPAKRWLQLQPACVAVLHKPVDTPVMHTVSTQMRTHVHTTDHRAQAAAL